MTNKPSFKQAQVAFAAHIRNPAKAAAPNSIEDRRMAVYRNLFINSISGLLGGSFPVMRSLFDKLHWQEFVRDFYQIEHNKTPHFPVIPREFVEYLKQRKIDADKPFLYELAHYEWLETHLRNHLVEITKNTTCTATDLLQQIPVISPLAKLHAYQYPVHQIKKDFQPNSVLPQPLFMLLWRDINYRVHFAELNSFSALLLEQLINNTESTGEQTLLALATQHQHPNPEQMIQFGLQALLKWYEQDIIINTKPA